MQAPSEQPDIELTEIIDDFEIIDDSESTKNSLSTQSSLSMEDFENIQPLTANQLLIACEKTVAWHYTSAKKEDYRRSFTCFGKPNDANVHLILLNILQAPTGDGNNSRKHDLLMHLDSLPKCRNDKESALRIKKKREYLITYLASTGKKFAFLNIAHKDEVYSTLLIDKGQLTGKKLSQAIKALNIDKQFLEKARPLDNRNALVRLLKILEQDPLLAFCVLSLVFDLNIHAGDKLDYVPMSFLRGFMKLFAEENIGNSCSNLYVLTAQYWTDLSRDLEACCNKNGIEPNQFQPLLKNMYLLNTSCSENSPFIWYPAVVLADLDILAKNLACLPQDKQLAEICSKLNHLLDIFDLEIKNLWLSTELKFQETPLMYTYAMLNGFLPLVAQIDNRAFDISVEKIENYRKYLSKYKFNTNSLMNPIFYETKHLAKPLEKHAITYDYYNTVEEYCPACSDGNYFYPAETRQVNIYPENVPYYLLWLCKQKDIFVNGYRKGDKSYYDRYVGLSQLCFKKVVNSVSNIKHAADLLLEKDARQLIANKYTEIPQAQLILSHLVNNKKFCAQSDKDYVDNALNQYLQTAAIKKHYPLVLYIAFSQKTSQIDKIIQGLCANKKTREAGLVLKSELLKLSSVEWWLALNQIAPDVPKDVKRHIFGFFSAVCEQDRRSVEQGTQPVAPK